MLEINNATKLLVMHSLITDELYVSSLRLGIIILLQEPNLVVLVHQNYCGCPGFVIVLWNIHTNTT